LYGIDCGEVEEQKVWMLIAIMKQEL
jgi:hypothetical protein